MTPKQEAFARAYVETGNASEAYRKCYSAEKMSAQVVNNEASKLLQHHEITVRVNELQLAARERSAVTVDTLTAKLEAALAKAMAEPKGASAAVSAVMGMGKLHGLIVDKQETTRKRDVADISDGELAAIARGRSERTSAPQARSTGADPVH